MSPAKTTIGLDIGGANLKACFANGTCRSVFFPMWKEYERLAFAVRELVSEMPAANATDLGSVQVAVTLTGELADCFATRSEGVKQILRSLLEVFEDRQISVYGVGGHWFSCDEATKDPWRVAASNWHALATWLLERASGSDLDLIVDIGSTTVDVLPVQAGKLLECGETDRQRLERQTLVYSGMERTPVAMLLRAVTLNGVRIPFMAEVFATTVDAYLALGEVEEEPGNHFTADGRPKLRKHAFERLSRQIGEDAERLQEDAIEAIASHVIDAQVDQLLAAVLCNTKHLPETKTLQLLTSGHGRSLMQRVAERLNDVRPAKVLWLDELLSTESSRAAPALAVAQLLDSKVDAR